MNRPLIGLLMLSAVAACAQDVVPAPLPGPGQSTITVNSQLVLVDVTVTDKKGKPIHGLKASNFTLMENGKPQAVKNFEEHTALSPEEAAKVMPA
jgi:hypothetical protein